MSISDREIVRTSRLSDLPAFRYPEAEIQGLVKIPDPSQVAGPDQGECTPTQDVFSDIGVATDLFVEGFRRNRKGFSTFIDVNVSFTPAPNAEYHQFRITKLVPDLEIDGEG
jgi:hypothetical protein